VPRVLAQGLIRGAAVDVTDACAENGGRIVIHKDLIDRVFRTEDRSAPAVMLAVTFGD
jgi:hypothetical protein